MNSGLFPVALADVSWSSEKALYSEVMCDWLFFAGSLTRRLQAYDLPFSVKVLSEKTAVMPSYEQALLMSPTELATIREVFLCVNETPWVYAQSVLPHSALSSGFASLMNIGNKPLGELLFTTEDVKRGELLAAGFESGSNLHTLLASFSQATEQRLIGRRSLFSRQHSVISVAEIFLPACPVYSHT